jgi:hypothetical protein
MKINEDIALSHAETVAEGLRGTNLTCDEDDGYHRVRDLVRSACLHCLTQAQESREGDDKHFDSYTKAILSLAMFDLAFHRLKSQALRLSVTRRNLSSDYQDAVLASELDKLIEIANEPEPTWPGYAARPIPSPGAEGDKLPPLDAELEWILGRPNFTVAAIGRRLHDLGLYKVETKAEAEQAAAIHYMLDHYLKHGALKWREVAEATLRSTPEGRL